MAPLLEVEGLSVRFEGDDGAVHAVDRLSFALAPGEVLAIVGESGCGKTTAALSLVRLLPATAVIGGRVLFDGVDLLGLTPKALRRVRGRRIAYVFQEPATALNPVLTIGGQIGEILRAHLGLSRRAARGRAIELLRLVHIPAAERRLDEYPHQLSGGMRQRVLIAMALACDPQVLIADEPTTALDATLRAGILDLLREIRDGLGTAIVVITHDLGVVADIADRVLVLYAGRKAEEAPTADLFAVPQHPVTLALLAAAPRRAENGDAPARLREIPGRVPPLHELPAGCAFLDRCPRSDGRECIRVPELRVVRAGHAVACFHPGPE
jgi:peptide/nickel transport system ATP-binding protein